MLIMRGRELKNQTLSEARWEGLQKHLSQRQDSSNNLPFLCEEKQYGESFPARCSRLFRTLYDTFDLLTDPPYFL